MPIKEYIRDDFKQVLDNTLPMLLIIVYLIPILRLVSLIKEESVSIKELRHLGIWYFYFSEISKCKCESVLFSLNRLPIKNNSIFYIDFNIYAILLYSTAIFNCAPLLCHGILCSSIDDIVYDFHSQIP